MLIIRDAEEGDIGGIVSLEEEEFGPVGDGAAASEAIMLDRLQRLNGDARQKWFIVAENRGEIVGDMVLQPTGQIPEDCTSWPESTDNGTLRSTLDLDGEHIYIVSLAASQRAPHGTAELLMHASLVKWAQHGGKYYFVSRMPAYRKVYEEHGTSPEEYVGKKRSSSGAPRDPMLYYYWLMSGGVSPHRLLRNGFPPDEESMGHGVLFILENPYQALLATAQQAHLAGMRQGRKVDRNY